MLSSSLFTLAVLPLAAPTLARLRIRPNQWAPAPLGSLVCPGTRACALPRTRFAAIIIVAACVAVPIVPYRAAQDQIVSRSVLVGADLGPRQLAPRLAKKHGVSNCCPASDFPDSERY